MADLREPNIQVRYDVPEFHTDHNVYILGAGYSAGAGLPLMTNFLEKMRGYRSTLKDNTNSAPIDAVLRFCLDSAKAANKIHLDLDNIETILSLAAASDPINPDGTLSTSLVTVELVSRAIASTLEYYQLEYQNKENNNGAMVDSHNYDFYDLSSLIMAGKLGKLKKQEGQRNTIITFNYDTLVEQSLIKHGVQYSYGLDGATDQGVKNHLLDQKASEDDVRILKLHGSINWSAAGLFDSYSNMLSKPENGNQKPIILPPWWKKDPSREISVVWNRAINRLKTATRIIFVGYSCPPTDQYMRYLLGVGLNDNISLTSVYVINIDQEAHRSVRELFSTTFRNVKQVEPMSAQGFFTGLFPLETGKYKEKGYLEEINRAIK